MKFTPGDDVVFIRRSPHGVPPGTMARVVTRMRVWDDRVRRIVHEYGVRFEGGNGTYSVEEEDLEHYGPLDRLAREA